MHPLLPVPQFKLKTTITVHQQLHEGICLLHFKGFCCESNFPFVHSHDRRVIYPFKPFFAQEVVGLIMSCSGISIIRSRIVGVDVLPCLSLSLYHHDRYQRGISHTIGTTWLLCLINISLTLPTELFFDWTRNFLPYCGFYWKWIHSFCIAPNYLAICW